MPHFIHLKVKVYTSKMNLFCLKTFQSNIYVVLLEINMCFFAIMSYQFRGIELNSINSNGINIGHSQDYVFINFIQ